MNMEQGDELETTEDTQELNAAVHTPKYWMNSTSMSGELCNMIILKFLVFFNRVFALTVIKMVRNNQNFQSF